jgi:hypothetical protein
MKPLRLLSVLLVSHVLFAGIPACSGAPEASSGFPAAPYTSVSTDHQALTLELRTAPTQPPERGTNLMQLRVVDAARAPKDGLQLSVVPWMPAHGHGSPTVPTVTATGDGTYRVDGVDLPMPGTWELRVHAVGAGMDERATILVEVR